MSQVWKIIPLFISSTFRDMHAERDQLNRVVFPAIEERLKQRRCRVAPIDLRVGVETDSTQTERERELQILKVCLAEIERSRPFLLVLLGDRYGWVPGEDRIKAASSEAGFMPEDNGGSVTALEIEYGLLKKDPVQRRRCLLCLREQLPYSRMPEDKAAIYSDAHATDPGAPERVMRLKKLKAKINADPEIAPHRKPYSLDWDAARLQPTAESVSAWGRAVEAELWKLLDEETKSFAEQAEPTWEEQERFAIEEQVERLNGSFVGRQPLIQRALELAGSATTQGAATGLIFTGGSGTGKSALFARLHHVLSQHQNILLLAHAAGVSPKSGQTEWMLRRWIGELGAALGETPDVPENIKPEDLEKLFAQLLHRVTAKRRVVLLVDALNQFLRTERARTVSWLPVVWPVNTRFIATTIPGEESTHLAQRPGLTLAKVPPLEGSDAEAIAAKVYARYGRKPNAEVLHALFALREADGTPAAGNPLWLTLALDLLNLLDADDFTAAEAAEGGSPDEKLRHLVLARARALPPDMEGLYGRLLAQVEKVAGTPETRAFAALIALSRHGWREEDFENLLPTASAILSNQQQAIGYSQFKWDPLRFAVLRRCFRAHLVKRGALEKWGYTSLSRPNPMTISFIRSFEQWDFVHTSLRLKVQDRLKTEWQVGHLNELTRTLHSCSVDYLETLPPGYNIIEDDLMWHILSTRDAVRVARYFIPPVTNLDEFSNRDAMRFIRQTVLGFRSSRILAQLLVEDEAGEDHSLQQFVISLLESSDPQTSGYLASIFSSELNDALRIEGHLRYRTKLLEAARLALSRLTEANPTNVKYRHHLTACEIKLSEALVEQGHLTDALSIITAAHSGMEWLSNAEPTNVNWQVNLCIVNGKIGELMLARGDWNGALAAFRNTQTFFQELADRDTTNLDWQSNLSISHNKVGEVLVAIGDLSNAHATFKRSLEIAQRLAANRPTDAFLQRNLAVSLNKVGEVCRAQVDMPQALAMFRDSLSIRKRLADEDAVNAVFQRDLFVGFQNVASILDECAPTDANQYWRAAYDTLSSMKIRGTMMPTDEQFLVRLRQKLEAAESSAPPISAAVHIPDPLAQPRRELSLDEHRESAGRCFQKGQWEAAASQLEKLLEAGEPLAEHAPKLITCLLNAHETPLESDVKRIETLLQKLEQSGHANLAAPLRQQLQAKLPRKKGWKFW